MAINEHQYVASASLHLITSVKFDLLLLALSFFFYFFLFFSNVQGRNGCHLAVTFFGGKNTKFPAGYVLRP